MREASQSRFWLAAVIAGLLFLYPHVIRANFSAAINYPGGSSSRSVAAADYDGDGDKDIALANFGDHTVSILLNTGGVFAAPVNYSTGLNPFSVFAADLDGDGDKDLVTANGSANTVSILLNNGSGVFTAAVNYVVGTSPRYAYAIDVDGDLDADLAVANATTNNVSVLLNNGSGVFAAAVNYAVGTSPRYVSSADLDGDLDADLAVVNNTTNNVSVLLNNGSGVFAAAVNYAVGTSPVSVYAADLDGDGDGDLVAANSSSSSNNVSVLLNSGNGTFAAAVNYPTVSLPFFAMAVDLDADGDRDIAAVASTNGMSILLNNGNGTFAAAVNYNAGNGTISIDAADFDTDGDTDLAVANSSTNNITLYKNNGNATFPSAPSYAVGSSPQSVVAADVDGDGDDDVLAANASSATVSTLLNNGSGILATAVNYATLGTLPRAVVASDLDGDGDKDIATANSGTNNVSVLLNNGSGVFSAAVTYMVNNQPFSITSADFDGDGDQDLAVVNFGANNGSLLFNNGNGTFAAAVTFSTGNSPFSVIASDLDADGDQDIAVANSASNSISVLLNNGSGVFAVSSSPAASGSPKAIFVADVDADADQDLMTANSGTNTVGVFLNNGAGVFAAMVSYAVGVNPQSLVAADYDRDIDIDLIVGNSNSGEVALLLNDGTGLFGSAVRYAAGRLPRSVFATDFDADGDNDVVVANEQGNNLSMLVNTSVNPVPSTASISPVSKNAGDGDFALTVNGTSFVPGSVVRMNGVDRATTFVSTTQVTALILSADLSVGGNFDVTVFNPTPGGGLSNAQSISVNNLVPSTSAISPLSKVSGEAGFILTVDGANFYPSSIVRFNGVDRATTFVSSSQLTAIILLADLGIAGAYDVTVFNSLPGGGLSNAQVFTVIAGGSRSIQYIRPELNLSIPQLGNATVLGADRIQFDWTYAGSNQTGFRLLNESGETIADVNDAQATSVIESGLAHNTLVSGRTIVAYGSTAVGLPSQAYPDVYTHMVPVTPYLVAKDGPRISVQVNETLNNLVSGLSGIQFELLTDLGNGAVRLQESPWLQTTFFVFEIAEEPSNYSVRARSRNHDGVVTDWGGPVTIEPVLETGEVDVSAYLAVLTFSGVDAHEQTINRNEMLFAEIRLSNNGTRAADNVFVRLLLPEYLIYVPGSIVLDGSGQTDEADQDSGQFGNRAVSIVWPSIGPLSRYTVRFSFAFDATQMMAEHLVNPEIVLQASTSFGSESDTVFSNSVVLMPDLTAAPAPESTVPPILQEQISLPNREEVAIIEKVLNQEFPPKIVVAPILVPDTPSLKTSETSSFFSQEYFRIDTQDGLTVTGKISTNEDRIEVTGLTSFPFTVVTLIFNGSVTVVVTSDANGVWRTFVDAQRLALSPDQQTLVTIEVVAAHEIHRSDRVTISQLTVQSLGESQVITRSKGISSEKLAMRSVQGEIPSRRILLAAGAALAIVTSPLWWWYAIALLLTKSGLDRRKQKGKS